MVKEEIKSRIFAEYEKSRQEAESRRALVVDEINKKFPRLKEIDNEINMLGLKNMKRISKNPEKAEEYNRELKEKFNYFEKERAAIIKMNGIDPEYKKPKYSCKKCSDRGIDGNGVLCSCYKQKLTNELYNASNLGEILKNQNFDNFSFDYYSKEKGKEKISPLDNMKNIYNGAKQFCQGKTKKNLLFYGSSGLGKTFLSSCIAKEIMDNGEIVIYIRASKLLSMYEDYKFNRQKNEDFIDNIYNADLLIIDDLGTENATKMNVSFIFDVIDERIIQSKRTIINTNLTNGELKEKYNTRMISRIAENYNVYRFYGEDIRLLKNKRNKSDQ